MTPRPIRDRLLEVLPALSGYTFAARIAKQVESSVYLVEPHLVDMEQEGIVESRMDVWLIDRRTGARKFRRAYKLKAKASAA